MVPMEDFVTLTDENGNDVEFEFLDYVKYKNEEYVKINQKRRVVEKSLVFFVFYADSISYVNPASVIAFIVSFIP